MKTNSKIFVRTEHKADTPHYTIVAIQMGCSRCNGWGTIDCGRCNRSGCSGHDGWDAAGVMDGGPYVGMR
jgi:hypothetical protein